MPHLNYADVIYDQVSNESWQQSFESLQYSLAIGITEAIRRTSSEKLFQELDFDSVKLRR